MLITKLSEELEEHLAPRREKGEAVGFVPTMGALHEGHLSLIRCSLQRDPVTAVSIFVNPTQFNDPEDLKKYPRRPEEDLALLQQVLRPGDVVFMPGEKTIYPGPDKRVFDFGDLDKVLEGEFRPGHFNGVAQVVSRLFGIVRPTRAYFGLKDFQQLAIIRRMTEMLALPVTIIPCPVIREADGLAMSSRNMRLSKEEREQAPRIYRTLQVATTLKNKMSVQDLEKWVKEKIEEAPLLKTEYFRIVHAATLQPVTSWDDPGPKQGLVAVWAGNIRLIDNIEF